MSSTGASSPLAYRRLSRADAGVIDTLDLDPDQVQRFLGPLADIVAAVHKGPAHVMVAIERHAGAIGFYVVHPDRRDGACWWLGWLALDRHQQGLGFGRAAMAHIMSSLRQITSCRRVRLLVAADNIGAMRLYGQALFRRVGVSAGGELILEAALTHAQVVVAFLAVAIGVVVTPGSLCHSGRLRLLAGPHEARVIGVSRGPPYQWAVAAGP